jgi:hypothetical protein
VEAREEDEVMGRVRCGLAKVTGCALLFSIWHLPFFIFHFLSDLSGK